MAGSVIEIVCSKCNKISTQIKKHSKVCRNCYNKYQAEHKRKQRENPEFVVKERERIYWYKKTKKGKSYRKKYWLWNAYRLTWDAYLTMLEDQNHSCLICSSAFNEVNKINVDHCHTSGKVRGLLCTRCNMVLGVYENLVPGQLEKMQEYLSLNNLTANKESI